VIQVRFSALAALLRRALFLFALCVSAPAIASDLQVSSYTYGPNPTPNGGLAEYSVRVANTGPGAVNDAVLTIVISPRFRAETVPTGCTVSDENGSQKIVCILPPLPASQTEYVTIDYTARATSVGSGVTTASVDSATTTDPDTGNDEVEVTTTVRTGADLQVTKNDNLPGHTITAGGIISYTINVANLGPDQTSAFTVTDNLPPANEFEYLSAGGTGWTCARNGNQVACAYSNLVTPGGPQPQPITITGRAVTTTTGTITNTATVAVTESGVLDPNTNNNGASVTTNVTPGTDVAAEKTMAATIVRGNSTNVTITARNLGPQTATDVTISDTFAEHFELGALPAGCSAVGRAVTCDAGTLNAGASRTFTIPVTAIGTTDGRVTNVATIGLPQTVADPDLGNNDDDAEYAIVAPSADLRLTKSKTPNPVQAGQTMTSRIRVYNDGPSVLTYSASNPSTPLIVTDEVSAGESLLPAASIPGWSCEQNGNLITCRTTGSGTLNVGAFIELALPTVAGDNIDGGLTNRACTGSSAGSLATPGDPASGIEAGDCNGATSYSTTVQSDLSVIKRVSDNGSGGWAQSGAVIAAEDDDFYIQLTAINAAGGQTARTVTVTDPLPNRLHSGGFNTTIVSDPVNGETIEYRDGAIVWTLSNLAPGEERVRVVQVLRPFEASPLVNGARQAFENRATITSPDTIDVNEGNNSSIATYVVLPRADVAVTGKSISTPGVPHATVGVIAEYTINIQNVGANAAEDVVVSDTIDPLRFELVGQPRASIGTADCSIVNAGNGTIECNMHTMIRNQVLQMFQQVRPRYPFGGQTSFPQSHTNVATIETSTYDPNEANDVRPLTHDVYGPEFDLAITKEEPQGDEYDPRRFGEELYYDIRLSNAGPSRANDILVTDTWTVPTTPAGYSMNFEGFTVNPIAASTGFTIYNPPAPSCTVTGANTLQCRLSGNAEENYLDANRQVILRLRFTTAGPNPEAALTFTNRTEVTSRENPASDDPINNRAVQPTTVVPSVDLGVTKARVTDPAIPVSINEPVEYRITVSNAGISGTSQVRVQDRMPSGFSLTGTPSVVGATGGASVSSMTCTGTTDVMCVLNGSFPAGGSATISILSRARDPYSQPLTNRINTAEVFPGLDAQGRVIVRDPNPANNTATAVVQVAQSSIAGTVFADADLDNIPDNGEGLSGVTVTLTGTDLFGNAVTKTLQTGANGTYTFQRLPAGTYTITETQPGSYFDYQETAGSVGGTVNNTAFGSGAPTNRIQGITLGLDVAATGYLFQEVRAASLSGTVYQDANNNGLIDSGEQGVPPGAFGIAQPIRLTGTDYGGSPVNLTTSVDANGAYQFTNLPPSNGAGYTVTQLAQPSDLSDGLDSNGAGAANVVANSAGRTAPEDVVVGTVAPGAALTNRNFGEIPTSTLRGMVFLDPNSNAVRDPGETGGLAGAIIRLTGTNDVGQAIDCSITTSATGLYSFPDTAHAEPACRVLRPGTYTLNETPPPGLDHTGAFIGSAGGSAGGVSGANTPAAGAANTVISNVVIAAGTTAERYDFGATGQGLSGYVYVDRNNNGVRDAGEPGIPGVTITLSGDTAGGQDVCTLIGCTATTDAAGNYLLPDVPGSSPAGYTLREQNQATAPLSAYADGTDTAGNVNGVTRGTAGGDEITGIVLATGELGTHYAFGERGGSLSGSTYIDNNDDGVRQAGETPIPGVLVTLSGTTLGGQDICALRAALNPALGCTATTGADGRYRFDDLPAGSYTLVEAQPTEFADGREGAGTPGGTVNNGSFGGTPATNSVINIPLGNGVDGAGYDFGERAITISGRVYKDVERDGVNAGGEPGIGGVTITLRRDGAVVATTTTGPDGGYRFENLPAGSYTVEETQPAGYGSSTPDSQSVNVSAGANQSIDFGETVSTLAGSVFIDSNDDGVRDAGERGIEGVTVRLTGTDAAGGAVDRTATTDASGNYRFDDLLSGTYIVTETQPAGFSDGRDNAGTAGGTVGNDAVSAIALGTGVDVTGYIFGERGQGQTGTVYVDRNNNGVQDPDEPGIPNVTVELQRPDGSVVSTVTTGPDGGYVFTDIEASDYVIVETQPIGYGEATENPSNRVPLTVGVGNPVVPINFGERVGSVAGSVYNDTNGNGSWDANEPAIPGVTLTLTGTDARGNALTMSAVSGDDGAYLFPWVQGGTYSIVETQPDGYDDGQDTPGTAGGTASGDTISGIALGAAEDATGYLFGERGAGAQLEGHVWLDSDHDRTLDSNEQRKQGWIVELLLNNQLMQTTTTDESGNYRFTGIAPGSGYQVQFRNPVNDALFGSARPNETGASVTEGVVSPTNPAGARTSGGVLSGLTLQPGANVQQQSLPLDPAGVVYDSVRRVPVENATVRISGPAGFDPAQHLVGGADNAVQVVGPDGMYQYLLLPGAPGGVYTLSVTPPGGSYNPVQPSSIIPPCAGPLAVDPTPDPLLVSNYNSAPPNSAVRTCTTGSDSTAYFLSFTLTPGLSANVVNNNIPIDPILEGAIEVTKSTPMVNVSRGGLVPYTITARNTLAGAITGITITDRVPAGFRYRQGSATIGGRPVEPVEEGRQLSWPNQSFTAGEEKTLQLILVVGSGVGEGEHVNQAFAINAAVNTVVSNVADATVRIVPDPDFDCTDILGKVFDDVNMNGVQDEGEPGLPGVRMATARGRLVTTDAEGRYHITCPMIPNEDRGSNFILKLDRRTLPTGYRMTTVNPETVRLTRGKFATLNFGAAIGRVVRLDLNGEAFEGEALRAAFLPEIEKLVGTLAERPSVLRIAYARTSEDQALVRRRMEAVREAIEKKWQEEDDRYRLIIEEEATTPANAQTGDVK
jgi:uncharacterized repeat protein (TIGR01451 family)